MTYESLVLVVRKQYGKSSHHIGGHRHRPPLWGARAYPTALEHQPDANAIDVVTRIMALQVKAESVHLTADERDELERLETAWSNAVIPPSEVPYPQRKPL